MKIWKVWGINLEVMEIHAECFDEAIRKARKINSDYNSAQIKE